VATRIRFFWEASESNDQATSKTAINRGVVTACWGVEPPVLVL
jgi:hypothetical protein